MAIGAPHFNPRTGLPCNCAWGADTKALRRQASQAVRKLRNEKRKIFQDEKGEQFLSILDKLVDATPGTEAMVDWFAQQYKKRNMFVSADHFAPEIMFTTEGGVSRPVSHYMHSLGQWMRARQHPLRRGINVMELTPEDVVAKASELQRDVAEKQEKQNWIDQYGHDVSSSVQHVFDPAEATNERERELLERHKGWGVHPITNSYDAEAETDALGHCIGQDEQPYKHNIEYGNIQAWSLRDEHGYPKVTFHHNPDGTLAHVQGRSGYPDRDRRDLISIFNHKHELDDANGGDGDDRIEQLEGGEQPAEAEVYGEQIDTIEEYNEQHDSGYGRQNILQRHEQRGTPMDEFTEAYPGEINWANVAKDAEVTHTGYHPDHPWTHHNKDKNFGFDPKNDPEDIEVYNFHVNLEEQGHAADYLTALVGQGDARRWDHDPANAVDHPNAYAAWLHYNGELEQDEEWTPLNQRAPVAQTPCPYCGAKATVDTDSGQSTCEKGHMWPTDNPPQNKQPTVNPQQEQMTFARTANILDPIHDELSSLVFDDPASPEPKLKPRHMKWIKENVYRTLDEAGYDGMENWLHLVFTGSLTTYQYSDESDVDVSLFVDTKNFPEWSRAEMIGVMVNGMDGTTMPGTPHPMQCFVVPGSIKPNDLYKPGLRSGYDIDADNWVVPPEKDRVKDVQSEMNAQYVNALQAADKMERLLRYEPDKAVMYWHQIHNKRRKDHQAGKGDYSDSNIVYKFLANRGLFPAISEVSGEYIAKTADAVPGDEEDVIDLIGQKAYDEWQFSNGGAEPDLDLLYKRHPEVREVTAAKTVRKFVYNAPNDKLVIGELGAREGENLSHDQLMQSAGFEAKDIDHLGIISETGYVQYLGGGARCPPETNLNQYRTKYMCQEALKKALPDEIKGFLGGEEPDRWADKPAPNVPAAQAWDFSTA